MSERPGFSALQRAENSSISPSRLLWSAPQMFQCSSASRKFLKPRTRRFFVHQSGFSALQRAENSSTSSIFSRSAASNGFSALQRAENSSILLIALVSKARALVSVLFSEPKIPQGAGRVHRRGGRLFQCSSASRKFLNSHSSVASGGVQRFQCSSASRKFLKR